METTMTLTRDKYYKILFISFWNQLSCYDECIKKYSSKYNINKNFLKSIITIEQINRGSIFYKYAEWFIAIFFESFLYNKDLSIGLCQIKPSCVLRIFPKLSYYKVLWMLLNPHINIHLCAKIISTCNTNSLENIVLYYTTGTFSQNFLKYDNISFYINLCKFGIKNNKCKI